MSTEKSKKEYRSRAARIKSMLTFLTDLHENAGIKLHKGISEFGKARGVHGKFISYLLSTGMVKQSSKEPPVYSVHYPKTFTESDIEYLMAGSNQFGRESRNYNKDKDNNPKPVAAIPQVLIDKFPSYFAVKAPETKPIIEVNKPDLEEEIKKDFINSPVNDPEKPQKGSVTIFYEEDPSVLDGIVYFPTDRGTYAEFKEIRITKEDV